MFFLLLLLVRLANAPIELGHELLALQCWDSQTWPKSSRRPVFSMDTSCIRHHVTFSEQTPRCSGLAFLPALEVFIDSCSLLGLAKDTCKCAFSMQVRFVGYAGNLCIIYDSSRFYSRNVVNCSDCFILVMVFSRKQCRRAQADASERPTGDS